ncbi:MAG: NAD-dependent epimerase/dehydratase family protein [Chloroflexi bacterium]|nr:MAG: NAD-dependent epimerase/dehydratase family protein [Chloroflexota bacterium]
MNKKESILVVGASGFLGQQIVKLLETQQNVIYTHYRNPLFPDSIRFDFFNDDIRYILDKQQVGAIIFASAVEMNNQLDKVRYSMERFARACEDRRIVYLSSDGIFEGVKGLYSEKDSPNPQTTYGKNLAICEGIIGSYCNNFCIVRPSYIYGFSNGTLDSRLKKTKSVLESGGTVTLFNDMFKSPLGVKQIASAVIHLTWLDFAGVVHVAGKRLSVYEFHRRAMSALNVDITHLNGCQMPIKKGFLRDTSLDSSLWQQLTGTRPCDIKKTLLQECAALGNDSGDGLS